MAKIILLLLSLIIILGLYISLSPKKKNSNQTPVPSTIKTKPTLTPIPKNIKESQSIFIPYWNIPSEGLEYDYDRVFYFSISPTTSGIDTSTQGYLNLKKFIDAPISGEKYLTLSMLNSDTNLQILADEKNQEKIIAETIKLAKDHNFAGIVVDLELSALPFDNVVSSINNFTEKFYSATQKENLILLHTMYGDVFFRKRPFDVKFLAEHTDGILIMAYDFHKARGIPGPNFPLEGKEKYGYDMKMMIGDFLTFAPPEKITVIFGMYGYDWVTDEQKRPTKPATAISLQEIQATYLKKCTNLNCVIRRDTLSQETQIEYVDSSTVPFATNHVVWMEDEESVQMKKKFLKEKGIGSTAFWVYGYF